MKKYLYNIVMLAAMAVAGAAFVSCEKENTPVSGQFTMTVEASMPSGGNAKALSLDGHTLHATWAVGEEVTVYNGDTPLGTLTAQSAGSSTTLRGTLEGTIAVDDVLTLKFLSPDYASQGGTLEYIAEHCDYAEATVTVSGISGGNITTTGHANFENRQAIVRFALMRYGGSALDVTSLTVSYGGGAYSVSTDPTDTIYIALPAVNSGTVTVTAVYSDGENSTAKGYKYEKPGVTFTAGQYYEIGVKMVVDLGVSVGDVTLVNGDKVTGTTTSTNVSIADGATVTLSGVNITDGSIICLGNANIILEGTNSVSASSNAGIFIPDNKTLTIDGTGSLVAISDVYGCAGIGGGYYESNNNEYGIDCGNITINGGTVTATGGDNAAGIGSGHYGSCGDITITGGTVTAMCGGRDGAGIGSGEDGSCGDITIGSGITRVEATQGLIDDGSADPIGKGVAASDLGTVTFGGELAYLSGSNNWSLSTEDGFYGGLTLSITNINLNEPHDRAVWTLTPPTPDPDDDDD